MDGGEPEKAVALLHQGATLDVTGQVSHRLWGSEHPYEKIWPESLEAPIDIPIPADVAALFGWNQLPQESSQGIYFSKSEAADKKLKIKETGELVNRIIKPIAASQVIKLGPPEQKVQHGKNPASSVPPAHSTPESLLSIQAELDEVANRLDKKQLLNKDGRFPIYVIFTTRQGLKKKYGSKSLESLDQEMRQVVGQVAKRREWGAMLIYADDKTSLSAFGLSPAQADDPWSLKLTLVDIDSFLGTKGEMIGAVLIVGGPEIVPYHNLPNPVDDIDYEVPSDSPYSTRDENYFVPEWPVGRLPGGSRDDASQLIEMLQRIRLQHTQINNQRNWLQRLWDQLRLYLTFSSNGKKTSWGYTAAIWRRASLSVFRPIGDPHTMDVSPPIQVDGDHNGSIDNGKFPSARMGYFNLHGLEDSGYWYGQRDPSEPGDLPDYPVALRPQDIGDAPQVVFSEACYGAHVEGRNEEGALALKFLGAGSQSFAGSTCTSYGSITTPLIAADLLGHAFWKYLREGIPAGESLRRAKIHLAKEMHRRQGYLDGEDQKTLISFLLFGDPLAQLSNSPPKSEHIYRDQQAPTLVTTVCDRSGDCHEEERVEHSLKDNPPIPRKTLAQVKVFVEQYLPGMTDANVKYSRTQTSCSGEGHSCATSLINSKLKSDITIEHNVVTLSKRVDKSASKSKSGKIHHHYARLTVDDNGKLIKLAVSR
jgi:hypothetical protein